MINTARIISFSDGVSFSPRLELRRTNEWDLLFDAGHKLHVEAVFQTSAGTWEPLADLFPKPVILTDLKGLTVTLWLCVCFP